MISNTDLDNTIYEILVECYAVDPPLQESEIGRLLFDQLALDLRGRVHGALDRLIAQGLVAGGSEELAGRYQAMAAARIAAPATA